MKFIFVNTLSGEAIIRLSSIVQIRSFTGIGDLEGVRSAIDIEDARFKLYSTDSVAELWGRIQDTQ